MAEMARDRRWDPCVAHRGKEVDGFLADYFAQSDRHVLLIAGAGFDPRSCAVATRLAATGMAIRAILIRENRPNPPQVQVERASANTTALLAAIDERHVVPVEIFGPDGAVVGGRNIVNVLGRQSFAGVTDVVVDVSALSVGTSFPIIRYFVERIGRGKGPANLHVFVAHDPRLDADIRSVPSDAPAAFLGAVVRYQHERVIGDSELEHSRQERVGLGDRVEVFLGYTESRGPAAERSVPFQALGHAFARDPVREPADKLKLWEVPFPRYVGCPLAQELVLDSAGQHRVLATADELGFRLGDEAGGEL